LRQIHAGCAHHIRESDANVGAHLPHEESATRDVQGILHLDPSIAISMLRRDK
jgi:hypothetical protein